MSSTESFVLSERFTVVRFPKLGLKPGWLKRQSNIHISVVYIYLLNGYRELNLFEEPCFTLVATITSLARELNPTGLGKHIYCHPQTDCIVLSELFGVPRHTHTHTHIYIYLCVCVCVCVCVCMCVCVRACASVRALWDFILPYHLWHFSELSISSTTVNVESYQIIILS